MVRSENGSVGLAGALNRTESLSLDSLTKEAELVDLVDKFLSLSDHSDISNEEMMRNGKTHMAQHWDELSEHSTTPPEDTERDSSEGSPQTMQNKRALTEESCYFANSSLPVQKSMVRTPDKSDPSVVRRTLESSEEVSLSLIYRTVITHREETRLESQRTQNVCRKLQNSVRRIAKTCSEFTARITEAEACISYLEDKLASQKTMNETLRAVKDDMLWKLIDLENRARRNNLRVFQIPEGVEGQDPRKFIIELFTEAFPE